MDQHFNLLGIEPDEIDATPGSVADHARGWRAVEPLLAAPLPGMDRTGLPVLPAGMTLHAYSAACTLRRAALAAIGIAYMEEAHGQRLGRVDMDTMADLGRALRRVHEGLPAARAGHEADPYDSRHAWEDIWPSYLAEAVWPLAGWPEAD